MVQDYGYANARIRAMKSRLFTHLYYEKLMGMENLQDITTDMGKTEYGKDLDQAMIKYGGIKGFDEALRMNIMKTFQTILKMVDGQAYKLVKILLSRWDIINLKTILRGKNIGASSEDIISSLVPAGELDEMVLYELVKQVDVRHCIDLMATWRMPYAQPLTEAFPEYAKRRSLMPLDLALDRKYYEQAFRKLGGRSLNVGLVREIILREIDITNIMTALRLVKDEIDPNIAKKFFIVGGKEISIEKLESFLDMDSIEDVVADLSRTIYGDILEKHMDDYFETGSLVRLERSMEETVVRKGISMFRADPLSIGLIIGYIWAKYNEITNLRIIARGKVVGMPEKKMREALIVA